MQPVKERIVHKNQLILQPDLQTIRRYDRTGQVSSCEPKVSP